MSKGDLRENAEYKAALEKQEMLKVTASRLKEEVQQAQIFNENEVKTDRIAFGTRVAPAATASTGQVEEYIILGPWESNPTRNVISYLSPARRGPLGPPPGRGARRSRSTRTSSSTWWRPIEKADLKNL